MGTAKPFGDPVVSPSGAQQQAYLLDPPLPYTDWGADGTVELQAERVVVSAVVAMFSGPETYIFPADEDGEVASWGEIGASQRGTLSHEVVLEESGYMIVERDE